MIAVQWGSVAEWVASVGTVAAVVVALFLPRRERALERQRAAEDEAARVSVKVNPSGQIKYDEYRVPIEVVVGGFPVWDVVVTVEAGSRKIAEPVERVGPSRVLDDRGGPDATTRRTIVARPARGVVVVDRVDRPGRPEVVPGGDSATPPRREPRTRQLNDHRQRVTARP